VDYAPLRHPFENATLYQDRTSLAVLVVYDIPNRDCSGQGAASDQEYAAFVDRIAAAVQGFSVAFVREPDAVAADCFMPERARLLASAIERLKAYAVYLDAGHPKWRTPGDMKPRLLDAGIAKAEGFAVNVANRQSTQDSVDWGTSLSGQLGGREFVVDTSRNGLPAPPDDQWCNPAQEALGERPAVTPGPDHVAAYLWIKRPGETDGACNGGPATGFWPQRAAQLVGRASWVDPQVRTAAGKFGAQR
jgi:endoglucanase